MTAGLLRIRQIVAAVYDRRIYLVSALTERRYRRKWQERQATDEHGFTRMQKPTRFQNSLSVLVCG